MTNLSAAGRLLESARGTTSKRKAAQAAGISEGRWRQIVAGVQKVGSGVEVPVTTKPATLVAMANAVGADPRVVLELAGMDPDLVTEVHTGDPYDDALEARLTAIEERLDLIEAGRGLPDISEGRAARRRRLQADALPQTEAAYDESEEDPDE